MFCCLQMLPGPLKICMGLCLHQVVSEEDKKARGHSSKIEQDLSDEQAKRETNVVKILLLGPAESGKSTLVKQMKLIHSCGFTKQELISFKPAILDNLLTSMKFVLQGMGMLRINLSNKNNKVHARTLLSCAQCVGEDQALVPFLGHAFCSLWADQGVRAATARGHEFHLNDSAVYFFEDMSRIVAPNYIPTERDVLRVRVRSCGIIETQFTVNNIIFRMYDVGAQRSCRTKWLSCFDSVQVLLFVITLSGYDMTLMEDPSVSRLTESLELFTAVCDNVMFRNTTMILFMNKTDLFREKILYSGRHLRFYLPSYQGADRDVDAAALHVAAMFVACSDRRGAPVFHHFTTATDTANIQVVFQVAVDQIIKGSLAADPLL
ncbi:guanine nucleotide binding protein (G protein) alpha v1 [Gadus macrocephalus]|uniref:guanine nucleotide binding protein (G protein) alpha v1 n=1 Tax=Gadus macrocephalus TaxID=80720 RepID=UPI0028CB7AFA|nr:guanine nucleotide binding protein (G protein) alpha v1 [Gadus macrocephalus]